jgi:hypothetical protein
MRRMAGTLLMAASVLFAAGTILVMVLETVQLRQAALSEDDRAAALAGWLLAGVFVAFAGVAFLVGRQLRRPPPVGAAQAVVRRPRGRPAPLIVYLAASIGVGVLAAVAEITRSDLLRPLGPLLVQPWFVVQLTFGALLGKGIGGTSLGHAATVLVDVVYFAIFFYPAYCVVTMDRAVERARYRRMMTLLVLFVSIHLLMALFLFTASKA